MKKALLVLISSLSTLLVFAQSRVDTVHTRPAPAVINGAFFKSLGFHTGTESLEELEGFEGEFGKVYTLLIERQKVKNPPADGSSVRLILKKVIKEEKLPEGYEFDLVLERDLYLGPGENESVLKSIGDDTYLYFDKLILHIKPELYAQLEAEWGKKASLMGKCAYRSDGSADLIGISERR